MFLLEIVFGILAMLFRLPRRLLLGLVLFVLAVVLVELVQWSPRSYPRRAAVARSGGATGLSRADR